MEKNFLDVNDVAGYLTVSIPTAYRVIKRLNNELRDLGYITVAGKISKIYFLSKVYGCTGEAYASI